MTNQCRRVVTVMVLILLAFAAARAATERYQEREDAFRKECQAERAKLGLSADDLRARYPTPEIRLVAPVCVLPGATAEVAVTGRFAAGAKFFVENDDVEIVKESITGNQYRATLKAAAGIGPETATLKVMNPVTAQTAQVPNAVRVGGRYEWTLAASNGWKVIARSKATDLCAAHDIASKYELSFFRTGENAAFEKIDGTLAFLPVNQRNYRFDLSSATPAPAGIEAFQALMQKLADPKLSAAEREKIMAKIEAAQKEMTAAMTKMTDPAYMKRQAEEQQRRQQEFGCRMLEMTAEGGRLTGEMYCSEKAGRRLSLTGTFAPMK